MKTLIVGGPADGLFTECDGGHLFVCGVLYTRLVIRGGNILDQGCSVFVPPTWSVWDVAEQLVNFATRIDADRDDEPLLAESLSKDTAVPPKKNPDRREWSLEERIAKLEDELDCLTAAKAAIKSVEGFPSS